MPIGAVTITATVDPAAKLVNTVRPRGAAGDERPGPTISSSSATPDNASAVLIQGIV